MKELVQAFDDYLQGDPSVVAYVGHDENAEVKLYPLVAPSNTQPPFLVTQVVPGPTPTGHYGDLDALDPQDIQVTRWGRTRKEAWELHDVTHEALERMEVSIEVTPYTVMQVFRIGGRFENYTPEVGWFSVLSTYRITLAR